MQPLYKRMLEGMQAKEKKRRRNRKQKRETWFVYILKCCDNTLYTGIAKDVTKRFKMHSKGKGARYTRTRCPLELIYQEKRRSRTEALVRECAIKALPKSKKLELIDKTNRTT